MSEFVNFYLFPALTIGSIYALGAVGISMIFGILRFAHFAHGDLMTVGTYGILAAAARHDDHVVIGHVDRGELGVGGAVLRARIGHA